LEQASAARATARVATSGETKVRGSERRPNSIAG